jgi:hypothetical protein
MEAIFGGVSNWDSIVAGGSLLGLGSSLFA